jgi:hypothetical protein
MLGCDAFVNTTVEDSHQFRYVEFTAARSSPDEGANKMFPQGSFNLDGDAEHCT